MQGMLLQQARFQLLRRPRTFQNAASYHKVSMQRFQSIPKAFFVGRSLSRHSSFNYGIIRRTFATSRGHGSSATASYAIWGFIGLNTIVFGTWQYAIQQKDLKLLNKLNRNFTTSIQNIQEGRWYTILTCAFSQASLTHFLFNMITFHTFTRLLMGIGIGGGRLLSLCFGSALASSGTQLYQWSSNTSDPRSRSRSGLGASGVVMGTAAVATCLVPTAPMLIFPIPLPIPLWAVTMLYVGFDAYYLHGDSRVAHAAHLGGLGFGLIYYMTRLRGLGGIWYLFRR